MPKPIQIFNLRIAPKPLAVQDKLPFFYSEYYKFFTANFTFQQCILLQYQGNYLSIPRIKHHFQEIPKLLNIDAHCVLWLSNATVAQQTRLLENQIPFFVEGKAIFLPFLPYMGIRIDSTKNNFKQQVYNQFSVATQCIFLYLLLQDSKLCKVRDLKKYLQLSQATISRGLNDLFRRNLLEVSGYNTRKRYERIDRHDFWKNGRKYLISPIAKRYYMDELVRQNDIETYHAGESALANLSILADPLHSCIAISKGESDKLQKCATSPNDLYTEQYSIIEIWRYHPGLFADKERNVDLFSLYASLGDLLDDERVLSEIENLIEEFLNGKGN